MKEICCIVYMFGVMDSRNLGGLEELVSTKKECFLKCHVMQCEDLVNDKVLYRARFLRKHMDILYDFEYLTRMFGF